MVNIQNDENQVGKKRPADDLNQLQKGMPQIANAGTRPVSAASNSETLQRRAMCCIGLHLEQKGNLACIASICLRHPPTAVFFAGRCGRNAPAASPNLLPSIIVSASRRKGVRRRESCESEVANSARPDVSRHAPLAKRFPSSNVCARHTAYGSQ